MIAKFLVYLLWEGEGRADMGDGRGREESGGENREGMEVRGLDLI